MRSLVAGILLGIAIAIVWRNLTQPQGTPPPKKTKTQRLLDTKEMSEYYERIREDKLA